ncbi:TIGR03752 family integrating conjugative element protein [Avibacterium sp. 21-599]|uniref:TIGR03752 family integrating conjugative element protein n=1 Tax=Avibacterium sp. 21-599 TaxID=2911528 RepID=UPI002E13695F
MKKVRADIEKANDENERLKRENQTLRGDLSHVNRQIQDAVNQKQNELMDQFEQRFSQLSQRVQQQVNTTVSTSDIPIGKGVTSDEQYTERTITWVSPDDLVYRDSKGNVVDDNFKGQKTSAFPNPFKILDDTHLGKATNEFIGQESRYKEKEKSANFPFYTIPRNATLMGAVSMTALLGRVPLNGSVSDPYPFKILVGRENLTANGIELPNVEGAIISGTATGDWTLSCVRGKVESMTFVFTDGSIVTSTGEKKNQNNNKGIGWLSNPEGIPCIPGSRKTNAPEYLTTQFFLSGAEAAAQGLAMGQTTTVTDGNSVVGAVTGNQGKYILGQALGGGLKETYDWLRQRYGQTFDAVYVPPGQKIAVHIDQQIEIDYDRNARKVNYTTIGGSRQMD